MTLYLGKTKASPVISLKNQNGGSGSTIRAYLPAEYSGSTEKGTKLLLNTKDYYVQETAEYTDSITDTYTNGFTTSAVGDECAVYTGGTILNGRYILYKDSDSNFKKGTDVSIRYVYFTPNIKDTFLGAQATVGINYVCKVGGGSYSVTDPFSTICKDYIMTDATSDALAYWINIASKENPAHIYTIYYTSRSKNGAFLSWNLATNSGTAYMGNTLTTSYRTVGLWSKDPTQRIYALLMNNVAGSSALRTFYWDINEHGTTGLTETAQTPPTVTSSYSSAVQFPTTLTINGEEVMYSFLRTGENVLQVFSFKESTMEWTEEPEIAQMIVDALGGSLSAKLDKVHIQPQIDGTLYCTNDLIMCAFSFNSDGTITQVAHPCSAYISQLENLVEFEAVVNKYAGTAGLCYRLSTDLRQTRGYMFHFVYFKLEPHEDTGELEWVAYDKKRSNYAVESITGISTGVTGTTEGGRDYVECSVALD